MWQLPVGLTVGAIGGFLGAKSQQGAIKRAGTVMQQRAEQKAQQAMARAEEWNPQIQEAYTRAQQGIESTAFPQADILEERAERAGQEAVGAAREAGGYLDPYRTAGAESLADLAAMGRAKAPTAADLEEDPGYRFRLAEGTKALERSAAARGGLLGGGTLRSLTRYSQSEASQEYANMFDRFMKQQEARRLSLSKLADIGLTAGTEAGRFLTTGYQQAGDWATRATQKGADIRVGAARDVGELGIASRKAQIDETRYADAIARGAYDEAAQIKAESIIGTAQANPWLAGLNAVSGGLNLWGLSKMAGRGAPTGGGGGYVPWEAIGGG
jgi:hypothetical protein